MTTKSEETLIEKLNWPASLQEPLLASDKNQSDDDQNPPEWSADSPDFYPMPENESPLDNAGPIPPEYQRDPYGVEIFPLRPENESGATKPRMQIQERAIWASAVAVSWSITMVAILKLLGFL